MKRTTIIVDLGNGQNLQGSFDSRRDIVGFAEETVMVDLDGLRELLAIAHDLSNAVRQESAA